MGKCTFQAHNRYRIIKIWDKHTMSLQASLHSHEDFITDLDISSCNRFLVSSSKDGKINVWDWQNCKKIGEINDHGNQTVNNIKFFTLRLNKEDHPYSKDKSLFDPIELLVSCSEDGTIRMFDCKEFSANLKPSEIIY